MDETTTPEELARALFGASRAFPQAAPRIIERLKQIVPEDSPEFGAVREMAWMRIVNQAVETSFQGQKSFSPQKFITGLRNALTDNKTLMSEVFTPEQIAQMRRFGVAVERTITPADARNNSRTGWVLIQQAREFFKSLMAGAAFLQGGALAAGATRTGLNIAEDVLGARGARSAVRTGVLPAPRSTLLPALGGAAGSQSSPNQ